jgi:hypothetical protein
LGLGLRTCVVPAEPGADALLADATFRLAAATLSDAASTVKPTASRDLRLI